MSEGAGQLVLTPWEEQQDTVMQYADAHIVDANIDQLDYEARIEAIRRQLGPIGFYDYRDDPGYDGFYIVTSNDLARHTLGHSSTYSSHGPESAGGIMINNLPGFLDMTRATLIMQDNHKDKPGHDDQRRVISSYFKPRAVAELEPIIRDEAARLVDEAVEKGEVDFVRDIAGPLPLFAIAEMLNVPPEYRPLLYDATSRVRLIDTHRVEDLTPEEGTSTMEVLRMATKIREKVEAGELVSPILDAISKATYNRNAGEKPTKDRPMSHGVADTYFGLLFLAGNETTRNSLAHAGQAFAQNPEQWRMLREDPSLLAAAVSEITRYTTPVRYVRRTAMEDVQLGGQDIAEGQKVVVSLTGANRDPDVFSRPHEFDITRSREELLRSLAFGIGTHACLGKHLAELEVRIALEEMAKRVGNITQVRKSSRVTSTPINSMGSLTLQLEAA